MSFTITEDKFLHHCFHKEHHSSIPFEDLVVSVSTCVVYFDERTNFKIESIFNSVPVYEKPLEFIEKSDSVQITTVAESGTILLAKFKNEFRGGVPFATRAFRNQTTLVMSIDGKNVNIFVFRNCVKITGLKVLNQIVEVLDQFLTIIQRLHRYCTVYEQEPVVIDYAPCMTNKNFNIGFNIDRERVDKYLLANGHISIFEPSVNSGVYLKIPRRGIEDKFHTFTIFHTGKILCSFHGDDNDENKNVYDYVVDLLLKNDIRKKFIAG